MLKKINSSGIKNQCKLVPPQKGKQCFIVIGDNYKIEMVCKTSSGKVIGLRWLFVCPTTGKQCRELHLHNGAYVSRHAIKGYKRLKRPAWHTGSKMDELLKRVLKAKDAETSLEKRYFKKKYNGKPTKKYTECLRLIEAAKGISMIDIINGKYNGLLNG